METILIELRRFVVRAGVEAPIDSCVPGTWLYLSTRNFLNLPKDQIFDE